MDISAALKKWSTGDNEDILKCLRRVKERDLLARARARGAKQENAACVYTFFSITIERLVIQFLLPAAILLSNPVGKIMIALFLLFICIAPTALASFCNFMVGYNGSDFYQTKFCKFMLKVPLINRMIEKEPQQGSERYDGTIPADTIKSNYYIVTDNSLNDHDVELKQDDSIDSRP